MPDGRRQKIVYSPTSFQPTVGPKRSVTVKAKCFYGRVLRFYLQNREERQKRPPQKKGFGRPARRQRDSVYERTVRRSRTCRKRRRDSLRGGRPKYCFNQLAVPIVFL